MKLPKRKILDKFIERAQKDIEEDPEGVMKDHVLAVAQDGESGIYMLLMSVPPSAFSDGTGPEVFYSSEKDKFIGGLNSEVLLHHAEQIENENPDFSEEEKNEAMAEFIAGFMPGLFEIAAKMQPLDI